MNPWVRARDALRPIHRAPVGGRKDAWIHHGFRALAVLLIALTVPWLFPRSSLPAFEGLEPGSVADRDVIARIGFSVPKSRDQIEAERLEAEAGVPTVLTFEPHWADTSIARTRALFSRIDSLVPALERRAIDEGHDAVERIELIRGGVNGALTDAALPYLTDEQLDYLTDRRQRESLRAALERSYDELRRRGVTRSANLRTVTSQSVVVRSGSNDRVRPLDSIPTMERFYAAAIEDVAGRVSPIGFQLFSPLLVRYAEPTLRLDMDTMRQGREQARRAVTETQGFVLEGERIITQYEQVGQLEYDRLRAYQAALLEQGLGGGGTGFWRSLGMVFLAASLLGVLVFTTYTFRLDIYEDLRSFSVLLGLILIVLAVSGIVAGTTSSASAPALIPIAFAGLLAAALFDALLGLVAVAVIAGILLGQPHFEGLSAPMLAVAGGLTAAFSVRGVRTRSQSWVLITYITAAYMAAALCLSLLGHFSWGDVAVTSVLGFGNATVCTALAMGAVLPALEAFTRRTTEQSLLELADMNRPLLRRLAREAPGTYAHSINMANLVEAACEAIGADSLLGRVGVYYHDVGKLGRPQYFIENQPKGINPHDRLQPSQSAEILRDHVREGLSLAQEARLPRVVRDFIREHHGTQQMRYFLDKARKELPDEDIDPNDFAYPGPKPQSKETAIAMLADAIESASRTLPDPSPERIRALIHRLVTHRVEEGQLDECGLTFRDLNKVKQEFARVLTGLFHHRIDYPEPAPALRPVTGGQAHVTGEFRAEGDDADAAESSEAEGGAAEAKTPSAAGSDVADLDDLESELAGVGPPADTDDADGEFDAPGPDDTGLRPPGGNGREERRPAEAEGDEGPARQREPAQMSIELGGRGDAPRRVPAEPRDPTREGKRRGPPD